MKLIVQIPCYNEAATLERTVADIPRHIDGVDRVEVLVIDDGSTDGTAEVARQVGVDHVVRHRNNKGLARSFRTGVDACLKRGADIIVNTDGDNQYAGQDIPRLIEPILAGAADIVVGDRQTGSIAHFSAGKRMLQRLGSAVVRQLSNTTVPDAVSGFRAISRDAAMQLNIVSSFSYTIEMLIQAGRRRMAIASVPVSTNGVTRQSRLFRSVPRFIERSLTTMLRMYTMYCPLRVFLVIGLVLGLIGLAPISRFLYFYAVGQGDGHIQSLVLGSLCLMMGFMAFLVGLVADLINFNRHLVEIVLEKVRAAELEPQHGWSAVERKRGGAAPSRPTLVRTDWPELTSSSAGDDDAGTPASRSRRGRTGKARAAAT